MALNIDDVPSDMPPTADEPVGSEPFTDNGEWVTGLPDDGGDIVDDEAAPETELPAVPAP